MRKIGLIIFREYWTRVRKKAFIITTLLAPVIFALFLFGSVFISTYNSGKKYVAIIDDSGLFEERFADKSDGSLYFKYPDAPLDSLKAKLGEEGTYDGLVMVPSDFDIYAPNKSPIVYLSSEHLGIMGQEFIENRFQKAIRKLRITDMGVDANITDKLDPKVDLRERILGEQEEENLNTEMASVIGFVMGFALYMCLIIYGTMIMKGVMEEKTNRIVEVMISSVKPFQLMISKILGLGLVGLTQFVLWGILISATNFLVTTLIIPATLGNVNPADAGASSGGPQVEDVQLILQALGDFNYGPLALVFLFFFIFGYIFYGSLFASLGAATNDDADMQSMTMPITMPIILSFLILMAVLQDPNSPLAFWASIIPFSSPIIMPARFLFDPPLLDVLLSMVGLLGGALFNVWVAAKIYRIGILLYGKKVSLKEIARWVRQ